jgi:excisionase family DNA binding protein
MGWSWKAIWNTCGTSDAAREANVVTTELAQNRLLRAEEVGRLLNIGKSTVYLQRREQKIPHVVIGHSVRIPEEALWEWLDAQMKLPNDK